MKILKEGNWKNPWSHEYVCNEKDCAATLLVDEADLMAPERYDNQAARYEFLCPVCGKKNDVPPKDLPLRIKEALDKKRKVNRTWSGDR